MLTSIHLDNIQKIYDVPTSQIEGIKHLREIFSCPKKDTAPLRQLKALDQISLTINEGDRVGFIGENGAGKSTLLGVIAGTISPTHGTRDIEGRINAILTLGLGLRDELSGRENLYLAAEMQGISRSELNQKIDQMIAFCELGKFIDLPMRCYSSGMKSKIAFTSVIFTDPEILILDETLSVGDHWFSKKAYAKMKELCLSGKIVLLVSHSLPPILEFCNRCVWLDHGKLKMDGDPKTVINAYEDFLKEKTKLKKVALPLNSEKPSSHYITDFSLFNIKENHPTIELVDEDECEIHISLKNLIDLDAIQLCFTLERLDSILITKSCLVLKKETLSQENNPLNLKIHLGKLLLRPGYYQCTLEILHHTSLIEKNSFSFEIFSDKKVRGGDPIFRWPGHITTHNTNKP